MENIWLIMLQSCLMHTKNVTITCNHLMQLAMMSCHWNPLLLASLEPQKVVGKWPKLHRRWQAGQRGEGKWGVQLRNKLHRLNQKIKQTFSPPFTFHVVLPNLTTQEEDLLTKKIIWSYEQKNKQLQVNSLLKRTVKENLLILRSSMAQ